MSPPRESSPDNAYQRLQEQLRRYLKEEMVSQKMLAVVTDASTEFLRSQKIMLSRTERKRLVRAVLPDIVDDMLNEL